MRSARAKTDANQGDPFVIWLDMPSAKLSPNARTSWRLKASLKKQARAAGWGECMAVVGNDSPKWHEVTIETTFIVPDKRRRDVRNMDSNDGMKAYIDGFVDAGLLKDDDRITWLPSQIVHEKGERMVCFNVWKGEV